MESRKAVIAGLFAAFLLFNFSVGAAQNARPGDEFKVDCYMKKIFQPAKKPLAWLLRCQLDLLLDKNSEKTSRNGKG